MDGGGVANGIRRIWCIGVGGEDDLMNYREESRSYIGIFILKAANFECL